MAIANNTRYLPLQPISESPVLGGRIASRSFAPRVIGISVRNIDDQNMDAPKFLLPPVRQVLTTCRQLSDAPTVVGRAGRISFPEAHCTTWVLMWESGVRGKQSFLRSWSVQQGGLRWPDLFIQIPLRAFGAGYSLCPRSGRNQA